MKAQAQTPTAKPGNEATLNAAWVKLNALRSQHTPFSDPERFEIDTPYREHFKSSLTHCNSGANGNFLVAGHIEERQNQIIFGPIKIRVPGRTRTLMLIADNLYWKSEDDLDRIISWFKAANKAKTHHRTLIHYFREPKHESSTELQNKLQHSNVRSISLPKNELHLVKLSGNESDLPSMRMKSKNRYKERKKLKDLCKLLGEADFREYSTPEQEDEFFESISQMSQNIWQLHDGLGNVQDSERFRAIYKLESKRGTLLSYILYAGSTPIAFQFGTTYEKVYHYEYVGFDSNYSKYSPGQLLRIHTFDELSRSGIDTIDFGPGGYEYKRQWGTTMKHLPEIEFYSDGLAAYYAKLIATTNRSILKFLRSVRDRLTPSNS